MGESDRKNINTMMGLLEAMTRPFQSRKTGAILYLFHNLTKREVFVREFFDDGKGHSNASTHQQKPVAIEVANEAQHEQFITGVTELGYVSDWKFIISDIGVQAHRKRKDFANLILELFSSGEIECLHENEASIVKPEIPNKIVCDILDWLTSKQFLESRISEGGKVYTIGKRKRLV